MPNDAVASAFLTGNGSADSLDALHQAFDDPTAAKAALGDFMANQVRQKALNPVDGSVNVDALNRAIQPYQRALVRFPDLGAQFRTASGAQDALDAQNAMQALRDRFSTGLGTQTFDANGQPLYSPYAFNKAVQDAGPTLQQAYGPQGAATVMRVTDELQRIAQTAAARAPGTSGTAQTMLAAKPSLVRQHVGAFLGTVGGVLIDRIFEATGSGGFVGAYLGRQLGEGLQNWLDPKSRFQVAVDGLRRAALTDPVFAQNLLVRYAPQSPSTKAVAALGYVAKRTPGPLATIIASTPPQPVGPQMLTPFQ